MSTNNIQDQMVNQPQGASSGEGTPPTDTAPQNVSQAKDKGLGKVQKKKGKGKRKVKNLDMLRKAAKNVAAGKDAFDNNNPDDEQGDNDGDEV